MRTAAEVDGRARERIVHRHDRVAVPRDAATVAERLVERLAERERRVLGRVVVARLEVAGALEDQVEARHGRRAARGSGRRGRRRSRRARGSHRRARAAPRNASPPSRGPCRRGAGPRATGDGRSSTRASASTSRSSSAASRTEIADRRPSYARTTSPCRSSASPSASPSSTGHVEEVRVRRRAARGRSRAAPKRAARAPRSPARTSGGDASAAIARSAESDADRRRRLPRVQLLGDVARARPRSRCAHRRGANAFENVRSTITSPSSISATAVSPQYSKYGLVDDERPRLGQRRRARRSGCSGGTRT